MSVPSNNSNYISETNPAYFNTQPEGMPPPPSSYQPSAPVENVVDYQSYANPSLFESQQQNFQYPMQSASAPPQYSNPLQSNPISSEDNNYNMYLSEFS